MTEHDALVAAICAQPDEDTPRLVFADFLEENGESERAAFIRAQIELARTPAWEPFAVLYRWRRKEWANGKIFQPSLPVIGGGGVEWNEKPFRRGLGWHINVRSLLAWKQLEPNILGRAPIGAMHLWNASTLDQWRDFATSPVIPRLSELHFATSPVEPLRVLRDAPTATGITDIFFERASGPGMSFVVEDLIASPLGQRIRGLHFQMGYESLDEIIDAVTPAMNLERLSFTVMGLTDVLVIPLLQSPAASTVTELDVRGNPLGANGLSNLLFALPPTVHTLRLAATGSAGQGFDQFARSRTVENLRRLDLSDNPLTPRAARVLSKSAYLQELRSLDVSRCRIGEREMRWLARAKFWPNLVELNLQGNPISSTGVRHLLDAPIPSDLTALVLSGSSLGEDSRRELKRKYGERVVFELG